MSGGLGGLLGGGNLTVVDPGNSTASPLAGAGVFTGTPNLNSYPDLLVTLKTDAPGTLYVDFSVDGGTNYDTSIPFSVSANIGEFHTIVKGYRTTRIRYVNGSTPQGYFRLQTEYGPFRQPNKGLQALAYRDDDAVIMRPVDWYQAVQEGRWANYLMETKFGVNTDVTAAEDIWDGGGDYTGQPVNFTPETVNVFSSSDQDTLTSGTGAWRLRIYGLKTSTSTAYESEDINLNGTNAVTSVNTWWRVNRAVVLSGGSGGSNVGTITVRSTTTTANVFEVMPVGLNQSQVACWTVPYGRTAWLKRVLITVARANAASGTASTMPGAFMR